MIIIGLSQKLKLEFLGLQGVSEGSVFLLRGHEAVLQVMSEGLLNFGSRHKVMHLFDISTGRRCRQGCRISQ